MILIRNIWDRVYSAMVELNFMGDNAGRDGSGFPKNPVLYFLTPSP